MIKSLNIDDPVVLESDLSVDYAFAMYSKVAAIINDNGSYKYILGDGKLYNLEQLRTPTDKELISYFGKIIDPTRISARRILERNEYND